MPEGERNFGILAVVSLYLEYTFKTDTKQIATETHRRIDECLPTTTIQYDSVYLTCSKKLTCSQLSPAHGTNRKIKETTNQN